MNEKNKKILDKAIKETTLPACKLAKGLKKLADISKNSTRIRKINEIFAKK